MSVTHSKLYIRALTSGGDAITDAQFRFQIY
jgi:hypothetical protein